MPPETWTNTCAGTSTAARAALREWEGVFDAADAGVAPLHPNGAIRPSDEARHPHADQAEARHHRDQLATGVLSVEASDGSPARPATSTHYVEDATVEFFPEGSVRSRREVVHAMERSTRNDEAAGPNEATGAHYSPSRRSLFVAASVAGVSMTAPAVARAEGSDPLADTSSLTDEEVAVVNNTAAGLADVETNGGIRLEDGTFQAFDFDMLFEALDGGHTNQTALVAAATSRSPAAVTPQWDNSHFGKCLAKKIGIADIKAIIKAFAEPKVRKALKSKQWKKASSIAFNILKKTSPKIAKFLIKKAAHSVLPGGVVGVLALAAGQCALGEI